MSELLRRSSIHKVLHALSVTRSSSLLVHSPVDVRNRSAPNTDSTINMTVLSIIRTKQETSLLRTIQKLHPRKYQNKSKKMNEVSMKRINKWPIVVNTFFLEI